MHIQVWAVDDRLMTYTHKWDHHLDAYLNSGRKPNTPAAIPAITSTATTATTATATDSAAAAETNPDCTSNTSTRRADAGIVER